MAADGAVLSDASHSEAEELLLRTKTHSVFFESFNDADVTHMASYLSVLSFTANQPILKKGEPASWVGIILSGELAAYVDGKVVGTMGAGTIVGELAFFTGGERMADVNGSVDGFIALMMTPHLLELLRAAPSTGCKLIRTLGTSALSQLAYSRSEKALDWSGDGDGASLEVWQWASEAFEGVEGLTEADIEAFCQRVRIRRFKAGEILINRLSPTRDMLCFVTSGRVELVINGRTIREVGAGGLLQDIRFFEPSLLPCAPPTSRAARPPARAPTRARGACVGHAADAGAPCPHACAPLETIVADACGVGPQVRRGGVERGGRPRWPRHLADRRACRLEPAAGALPPSAPRPLGGGDCAGRGAQGGVCAVAERGGAAAGEYRAAQAA